LTADLSNIFTSSLELITRIPIAKSQSPIDYNSKMLSLGSCFAVNMAAKFSHFQFQNAVNPFGILFHPLAIEKFFDFAIMRKSFFDADIFCHNGRWHCFDAHSDLSHPDKNQLLENLNTAVTKTQSDLNSATHIVITLGTAWAYRDNASGNLVANCHKIPQAAFSKELLSVAVIGESLERTIAAIHEANPSTHIILTVSPVRHIKDGFVENQRSKAHLIAAVHEVLADRVSYFPSYEIMMDELRDYRFYADDLLHPSVLAIDYIWEKFAESWIASEAFPVMAEVDSVRKALAHRSFNPDSAPHRNFLKATHEKAVALRNRFPHMAF
jgi:hypothetical protein